MGVLRSIPATGSSLCYGQSEINNCSGGSSNRLGLPIGARSNLLPACLIVVRFLWSQLISVWFSCSNQGPGNACFAKNWFLCINSDALNIPWFCRFLGFRTIRLPFKYFEGISSGILIAFSFLNSLIFSEPVNASQSIYTSARIAPENASSIHFGVQFNFGGKLPAKPHPDVRVLPFGF